MPLIGLVDFVELRQFFSGNLAIRQLRFLRAFWPVVGHAHNFDHTTYCLCGALLIEILDANFNVIDSVILRPSDEENWFLIEKQVRHRLTALEVGTKAHCIFSHRDRNGGVVQEYEGNEAATV